jgi:hypothetical protein
VGALARVGGRELAFDVAQGDLRPTIGASGFYVAALHGKLPFPVLRAGKGLSCPGANWNPKFVALDADGNKVLESQILLVHVDQRHRTAGSEVTPHGPYTHP